MATLNDFKDYINRSKGKVLALKAWLVLKGKDREITLADALQCVSDAAHGKVSEMDDIIAHLTNKKKTYGRGHVYVNEPSGCGIDIVKDKNGKWTISNYQSEAPLTAKGQKVTRNSNIFKANGQTNRNYQQVEDRMLNIGAELCRLYPRASKELLEVMIDSVRKYSTQKRISADSVIRQLENNKLQFNRATFALQLKENKMRKKTIIITESMAEEIGKETEMTEYKFNNNLRHFLRDLLADPINAKLPEGLTQRGYSKSRFIEILKNNKILYKQERISDTDEMGAPKTVTMMVKYRIPRADLDRKIQKLYIKIFEKNVPEAKKIEEDGEGGATCADASGQFTAPCFGVQRRQMAPHITDEATTTATVGDYTYTAPAFGDKETLARHNGVGGSVSVNRK